MIIWGDEVAETEGDGSDLIDPTVVFPPTDDPEADSLVDEFVDLFNARDLEGMCELFAPELDAEAVFASGSGSATAAFETLFLREPSVMITRGELASRPLAAVWHAASGDYVCVGYLLFEFTDAEPILVSRIDLVDELDGEELLVETPDDAELPEWEIDEDDWDVKGGEHL